MKKQICKHLALMGIIPAILVLTWEYTAISQPKLPIIPGIPQDSLSVEITVADEMIKNNYYYKISYVANGNWRIPISFYNKQSRERFLTYSDKAITQVGYNKFLIRDSWNKLKSGEYLIAFISPDPRLPSQEIIQTLKISSNTKEVIEQDKHTLIVNESTGVAPQKGTADFQIRYELNDIADMRHKITSCKDYKELLNQEKKNVPKGTRGFDWDRKNAEKNSWYRAEVTATSITDKGKRDHDLSGKFQAIE